jgi:hypothetical protein
MPSTWLCGKTRATGQRRTMSVDCQVAGCHLHASQKPWIPHARDALVLSLLSPLCDTAPSPQPVWRSMTMQRSMLRQWLCKHYRQPNPRSRPQHPKDHVLTSTTPCDHRQMMPTRPTRPPRDLPPPSVVNVTQQSPSGGCAYAVTPSTTPVDGLGFVVPPA